MDICGLAPTILKMMGVSDNRPTAVSAAVGLAAPDGVCTCSARRQMEDEAVRERLRNLGYMS